MTQLKINGTIENALKVISKLESVNSDYAEEFYNNITDPDVAEQCLTGFGVDVDQTFDWSETPQGDAYWSPIQNAINWD